LELPRHAIALQRGQRSRDKLIRIAGLTSEDVPTRMRARDERRLNSRSSKF
jgi:uncharacterized protein YggU (UPF0235/DUF167 family)